MPATIVDLVGAKSVPPMLGKSLMPDIDGDKYEDRDVIVDLPEDDYNERRRAIIHDKTKLIAFGNDIRYSPSTSRAIPVRSTTSCETIPRSSKRCGSATARPTSK